MGCVTVCGVVEGGALADAAGVALAAFLVFVAVVLAVAVVSALLHFLAVAVVAFLVALAALSWVVARLIWYHGDVAEVFRRHRRVRVLPVARQSALPAGTSLMLEQAPPKVYVITDARERTGHGR